jgi:hypothetical protein
LLTTKITKMEKISAWGTGRFPEQKSSRDLTLPLAQTPPEHPGPCHPLPGIDRAALGI